MTTKAFKDAVARAERWPAERQEDAARMLAEMERQDRGACQLSDVQAAEVERRLNDPDASNMTVSEARSRLSKRGV